MKSKKKEVVDFKEEKRYLKLLKIYGGVAWITGLVILVIKFDTVTYLGLVLAMGGVVTLMCAVIFRMMLEFEK